MKKALIYGNRICQVENESFPVAEPLFWADVDDDVQPHTHEWRNGAAVPIPEPEPEQPVVPESVTQRQARLALLQMGKLNEAEAALQAIEDAVLRKAALIEWEYADIIRRDHPLIAQIATALEITEQEIDELFLLAGSI